MDPRRKLRKKKIALSVIIAMCAEIKASERRLWCSEYLSRREEAGSHVTILRELRYGCEEYFVNYMRMDPRTFYDLLSKVGPHIAKQDTNMRQSISAEARLHATLLFLSHGCSYRFLHFHTRISKQSLSEIIPETCQQIYEALSRDYLKVRFINIYTVHNQIHSRRISDKFSFLTPRGAHLINSSDKDINIIIKLKVLYESH